MALSATARSICTRALLLDNIISSGETPTAALMQETFQTLKEMVDADQVLNLTVLAVNRVVYPLVSNQQTYSIGPAALTPDFSTGLQPRPTAIEGAGLVLGYTTPNTEVPLFMLTDDLYEAIGIKAQTSTQPTQVYYNPVGPDQSNVALGTIFLWPKPTVSTNSLALYVRLQTLQFADLSTTYVMPSGYLQSYYYRLAVAIGPPNARTVPDDVKQMATTAFSQIKRANVKMADLSVDPALAPLVPGGSYNILSDQNA